MQASFRTHVYQIYHLLATPYEVLLRWRSEADYAASLHSAVLEANQTPFTNAATASFYEKDSSDRAAHVSRSQGRAHANIAPGVDEWNIPRAAWARGGGTHRRAARLRQRGRGGRERYDKHGHKLKSAPRHAPPPPTPA